MINGDRIPLSLIWHEEEGFPFNVGLSKPKMTTNATLGLGKNCPHTNISHASYVKFFYINHLDF